MFSLFARIFLATCASILLAGSELLPQKSELPALIERAKHYEHQALTKLCEFYYTDVYSYICYRVNNVQDAEDLTDDVFLKMVEAIRSCRARTERSFLAWLFRIANNSVVDHRRRQAVRDHLPLHEKHLPTLAGPEGPVEKKLTRERLQRALLKLTDEQQQVIILRFIEGLSNAETAQILGKSEGAIRSLQHRGLVSLRCILDGGGGDSA
jgi:RNA polymerase sigma-70 factor (ECF subfamily)